MGVGGENIATVEHPTDAFASRERKWRNQEDGDNDSHPFLRRSSGLLDTHLWGSEQIRLTILVNIEMTNC